MVDLFDEGVKCKYAKDEEAKAAQKEKFCKEIYPNAMGILEKQLAKSKSGYLVGDKGTMADSYLNCILYHSKDCVGKSIEELEECLKKKYPLVHAHKAKVESNPAIKSWIDNRPVTDL